MSEENPTSEETNDDTTPVSRRAVSRARRPPAPRCRSRRCAQWLRNWVGNATGLSPDTINESAPMVELGLSSRDAVAMASDIEDLTGTALTATVAFRHPTIEALAQVIVEGEPEEIYDATAQDWCARRRRRRHRDRRPGYPLPR